MTYRLRLEPLEDRTLLNASFAEALTVSCGNQPAAVAVGDFNGDHRDDFAVANNQANSSANDIGVFLGNGDGTFQIEPRLSTTANAAVAIAVGDFLGNGRADLLVVTDTKAVNLFLGNGDGTFSGPGAMTLNATPTAVVVGDFNGDGKLDFAVTYGGFSGAVGVFLGHGDGAFQISQSITAGNSPSSVAVGDFNGDGKLDLAVVNYGSPSVSILLGNGNGTFAPNATFSAAFDPHSVVVGDFNGDGKQDLAVTMSASGAGLGAVDIFLGNGDGSFETATPEVISTTSDVNALVAKDFNGDGKLDLAVSDNSGNNVHVLLNDGNASFDATRQYLVPGVSALATGDFNGDGKPDLVAINRGAVGIASVLLGNGNGAFKAVHTLDTGTDGQVLSVAAGDFTGDGKLDLAFAGGTYNSVGVLLNNGPDTFLPPRSTTVTGLNVLNITPLAVADLNGDGKADMIVTSDTNTGAWRVDVLQGNGDGTFKTPVLYPTGSTAVPRVVTLGDFNGDGKLDVAVANQDGSISVLLGNGDGTFQSATVFAGIVPGAMNTSPSALAVGDFNKDGKQDLVEVDGNIVGVFLSNGDGTFHPPSTVAVDGVPVNNFVSSLAVGDLNGDGNPDVAVAFKGSGTFGTLLGNGTGTLAAFVPLTGVENPVSVALGDINGDGKQDLAVVGDASDGQVAGTLSVLLGNGNDTFALSTFSVGVAPNQVILGDFNGGGALDVAIGNGAAGPHSNEDVSVLINTGPTIAGFTPASGPTGASVTLTGTDFVGVSAVAFNGVATSHFTVNSPTSITVIVPAGATTGPIGVATADGVARSAANFTVTPPSFMTASATGAVGQFPTGITVGDFDGDGRLDTAVVNYGPTGGNSVSILFGSGTGGFAASTTVPLPTGTNPFGITTGKFITGSNNLALVTGDFGGQSVAVIQGNGNGTFKAPLILPAKDSAGGLHKIVQVAVGDLNGDGKQDIVAISGDGTYTVFLGNGDGSFAALPSKSALTPIFGVAIGNFTTGTVTKPGLVVSAFAADKVGVLLGNGDGTFGTPTFFNVNGASDEFLATGDFNHDGKTDVAVANKDSGTVSVLLGNGNGTFATATTYAVGSTPLGIAAADVTNDGNPDLAVADLGSSTVSILLGNGNGTFAADRPYVSGPYPIGVAVGGFKQGEGVPDIVAANFVGNPHETATLATNSSPTITSFTPPSGAVGSQVVITGTNFVNVVAVAFNGLATSSFVVNSATQITVVVPAGATTGPIGVATAAGVAASGSNFTVTAPPAGFAGGFSLVAGLSSAGKLSATGSTQGPISDGAGSPALDALDAFFAANAPFVGSWLGNKK